jgi:hypothetical protein
MSENPVEDSIEDQVEDALNKMYDIDIEEFYQSERV